jgi:GT2 family glycosyltransferase
MDLNLIMRSGLFDRDWYLARYPDVRNSGMDPVLHYLQYGASEGRDPSPDLDSAWYLSDYLTRHGIHLARPASLWPIPRLAVLLHIHDEKTLPVVKSYLSHIRFPFTLFILTDTDKKRKRIERDFVAWYGGRVEVRVNRDIAPAIIVFRDVFYEYSFVLHLYSKELSHVRVNAILDSLLGAHEAIVRMFQTFKVDPDLGIVAPRLLPLTKMEWGKTFDLCQSLARRLEICITPQSPIDFSACSMFLARSVALRPLLDLNLKCEEFPEEDSQNEGTLADAIERLNFYVCELAGFTWAHDLSSRGRSLLPPSVPRRGVASDGSTEKDVFRVRCEDELTRFLAAKARIVLPTVEQPELSILIIVHNQAGLTLAMIRSLAGALDVPSEVIIVDNASEDRTCELFSRVDGINVICNSQNIHFLRGVNQAAARARGGSILLLNNDVCLTSGAIKCAHETLHSSSDIAAVGGKIVLLDGSLQEAGSIIWRDGTCCGYGRGRNPREPEFQFRRDVDYCSGAFLMVRADVFKELNGLDERFAPAYYEETDLCMRMRKAGYRVVYDPRISISHFEFGSSSSRAAALALQEQHRSIFYCIHREALNCNHVPPQTSALEARMCGRYRGRVLFIDDRVPFSSRGSCFQRPHEFLHAIHAQKWFITVFPLYYPGDLWSKIYTYVPSDVEVINDHGQYGLQEFLRERIGYYDIVIVSRLHNMKIVRSALRAIPEFSAESRLVYDAEALVALREGRLGSRRGPGCE